MLSGFPVHVHGLGQEPNEPWQADITDWNFKIDTEHLK